MEAEFKTSLRLFQAGSVKPNQVGHELTLVREPDNKYDKNAIMVFAPATGDQEEGKWMGYLPREVAHILAPINDAGLLAMTAKLDELAERTDYCRVKITLTSG